MTDVLVVCGDRLWPGGGRTAGLVEALATRFAVRVLAPAGEADPPPGAEIVVDALPDEAAVPRLVAALSPQPRRGRAQLGPVRSKVLLQAVADHRPRALLFTRGYLAAASPTVAIPVVLDFPDVAEARRRWWAPVEARRAVVVSAATADDLALLVSWGARAVLVEDGSPWNPLADAVAEVVRAT